MSGRVTGRMPESSSARRRLESWPGDGSITIGVQKKLRHCGQAAGILIGILPGKNTIRQRNWFDTKQRHAGRLSLGL
jgi:hypothetical protein